MYLMGDIITHYLPFLLAPFVSYLTLVYIYPLISFRLKQHLQHVQSDYSRDANNEDMAIVKVDKKWKVLHLEALLTTNWYVYFIIIWLCIFSNDNESKGTFSSIDYYIPYIHKILSLITIIFFFTIVIGGAYFKWRKFSFTTAISLSITVNIIYMVCYFFPRMLVEFINNPLQATYNCCMFIVIIISSYPLIWYCFGLNVLFWLALQKIHFTLFSLKSLFNILLVVILIHSFCCICMCFFMFGIILGSEHAYDYLKVMCLLIGLSVISLFKSIHHCAYKHVMANAEMITSHEHTFNYDNSWMENVGEESSSVSYSSTDQDFINHSTNSYIIIV